MENWTKNRLGDVCSKIGSGATPTGGKENYLTEGPFSLIRSQNVLNECFSHQGLAFISEAQAKKLDGVAVSERDVLLNITGDSVARVCMVDNDVLPARVNQHVAIIRADNIKLDSGFLRYFLVAPKQQEKLLALASAGATRNALTKGMIENFQIPLPPLPEQRAIASVLGSLDEQIEGLRRQNATLEALAQTLFRAWFVDFEPVKAKAAGLAPACLDEETAALFPDSFEDGLPVGWEKATLSDFAYTTLGGDWGNDNATDRRDHVEIVCLRGADLESLRFSGEAKQAPRRWVARSSVEKRIIADTDVLIGGSGAGPCGKPFWGLSSFQKQFDQPVIYSNFVKRFRTPSPSHACFLYRILLLMQENGEMQNYINGTSVPNLSDKQLLQQTKVVLPPQDVLDAYFAFVEPISNKLFDGQARTLAQIRDSLLPRLLSGALRVPESLISEHRDGVPMDGNALPVHRDDELMLEF